MTPVKQTLLTDRSIDPPIVGNCFQACVASLLDRPLSDVPHFAEANEWPLNFHRWLDEQGLTCVEFKDSNPDARAEFWGHHMIIGPSPRAGKHAVIGLNGEIVFDPHPSNEGLGDGEVSYAFICQKR